MFGELMQSASVALTIVAALLGGFYLWRYVGATNVRSQLDAKDGAIATMLQSIEAGKIRQDQLEDLVKRQTEELSEARRELAVLREKLEAVETYAAPQAVERFEKQQEAMIEILQAIQSEITQTSPVSSVRRARKD